MGFNEFLSSIFGNKSTRDMKEIKPWVEKIKAAYPEIEKLDNDALRAKTEELKKYIHESATAERAKVEELKASIEMCRRDRISTLVQSRLVAPVRTHCIKISNQDVWSTVVFVKANCFLAICSCLRQ